MSHRLLKNGAIYTCANIASAGVPFALLPILTRSLSPEEYGEVVGYFLLVTLAASVAGLNTHGSVAVKWFQREHLDHPRYIGNAILLTGFSTLICASILLIAQGTLSDQLSIPAWMWPAAALMAGATTIVQIRTTLWHSQLAAWPAATFQLTSATLNIGLSLLAVVVVGLGASGRNGGACLAAVIMATAALYLLHRSNEVAWKPSKADLQNLLRFGLPLVPHALAAAVITSADRYAVSSALGTSSLGIYGAAAQLGMVLNVLSDAAVKTVTPWLYQQLSGKAGTRGRLRVVGAAYLAIPLAALTALLAWLAYVLIGGWLLGEKYQAAIALSAWFLAGGALTAVYLNIAGLFFFTARTEWLAIATGLSAVCAVIAAPWLTATYGLEGAAASYCLVQGLQTLFAWLLSMRIQPMPWLRPMLSLRLLLRRKEAR